jgi:hypothetical protein
MQFFPGMSFADTSTNSSHAIPGPKLISLIFPRAMLLRTVAPYSMLGTLISSMYRARPLTLSRPSLRGVGVPTMGSVFKLGPFLLSLKTSNFVREIRWPLAFR